MTYEEDWKEQLEWLKKSITYMKQRQKETTGKEQERIKNKLDGLNVAYQHMLESEKMYDLK